MKKTYFKKGRIFIIILLFSIICSFHSTGNLFVASQSPRESSENNIQLYQQEYYDSFISENNIYSYREIRFPGYAKQDVNYQYDDEKSNSDGVNFFGQSNNSCYIVKVSSPSEIYIKDFFFEIGVGVEEKKTSGAGFAEVYITNKSWLSYGGLGDSEGNFMGNLRFVHFKFGKINYTYDNRIAYNKSGTEFELQYREPQKPILSPGTWYFIFVGYLFDLPQEDTIVKTSVWLNFTDECTDLQISSYEDGKLYDIWYGEFDANVIISKAWRFEMMINGIARFPIKNTFIYCVKFWPFGTGFWRLRLKTPDETHKLNMKLFRGYHFPDIDLRHICCSGVDGPGDYELKVNYIDFGPLFHEEGNAFPTYFLGMDVDLR